jgi:hypothetical protein
VHVVLVLVSVVKWYKVNPVLLTRTSPIPGMDRVPTCGAPLLAAVVGDEARRPLVAGAVGEAAGEALLAA